MWLRDGLPEKHKLSNLTRNYISIWSSASSLERRSKNWKRKSMLTENYTFRVWYRKKATKYTYQTKSRRSKCSCNMKILSSNLALMEKASTIERFSWRVTGFCKKSTMTRRHVFRTLLDTSILSNALLWKNPFKIFKKILMNGLFCLTVKHINLTFVAKIFDEVATMD